MKLVVWDELSDYFPCGLDLDLYFFRLGREFRFQKKNHHFKWEYHLLWT